MLLAYIAWRFRRPASERHDDTILWEGAVVSLLILLYSPLTWRQHCVAVLPAFYLHRPDPSRPRRPTQVDALCPEHLCDFGSRVRPRSRGSRHHTHSRQLWRNHVVDLVAAGGDAWMSRTSGGGRSTGAATKFRSPATNGKPSPTIAKHDVADDDSHAVPSKSNRPRSEPNIDPQCVRGWVASDLAGWLTLAWGQNRRPYIGPRRQSRRHDDSVH